MRIRNASRTDGPALARLAGELAHSFPFSRQAFDASLDALVDAEDACLLVAVDDATDVVLGYLLGFDHFTFFAGGRVAWVEEMFVDSGYRRRGVGRRLIDEFLQWTTARGSRMVALATRRATPFYRALGFAESATYLRKMLTDTDAGAP